MWRITYDLASHDYTNDVLSNTIDHHIQCVFVYPKWCGDGDITNNEQCDDGNTTNGDGCSNTCIDEPDPVCNNLSLSPTTMTNLGGNITATCSASNATGYKFLLKRGTSVIETRNYLTSPTATFTLPGNTSTNALGYTVECYVQGGGKSEITSASCDGSIVVPETPAVCNTLTLSHTTVQTNVPVMYTCSATNATSYTIKRGSEVISSLPEGTMNFSTPGTYSI